MLRTKWMTLVGLLAVVCIMGCADPGVERPSTAKVTGTVTLDGDAVAGAVVKFSPKGAGGHAASGTTDDSGNFALTTFESGDGAVPGSYQITVSKTEGGAAEEAAGAAGDGSEENYEAVYESMAEAGADVMAEGGSAEAEVKDLLPAKYKDPATSGFEEEVTEGGENSFTFALES